MPIFWWLGKAAYVKFIARELTSLFVAYAAVLLLLQVRALAEGGEAALAFRQWFRSPWVLAFHGFVVLVLAFHSFTWLGLAPRALVIRVGGKRVPDAAVLLGHYGAWAFASAAVALLLLGGAP